MAVGRRRLDGDVHGGVGHEHRERVAAAHRRQPRGRPGRIDLGADQLSGRQRDHHPDQRVAVVDRRPQDVLHDLRRGLHRQQLPLRHRPEPRLPPLLPRAPGGRRRRPRPERAGDARRHVPRQVLRPGVRHLRRRRRRRPRHRPGPRRVDHRHLLVAVDLLHEHPRRHPLPVPHLPSGAGPAGGDREDPPGTQGRHPRRLCRLRLRRPRLRVAPSFARQGAGGRLVRVAVHRRVRDPDLHRPRRPDRLGDDGGPITRSSTCRCCGT